MNFVNSPLSKSVVHCSLAYETFFISNHLAAMENSSVYMCFPCYREFNTLEEVLEHQLTCTAEDEQPDTSGTTPVTIPVLQTQVNAVLVPFYHVLRVGVSSVGYLK